MTLIIFSRRDGFRDSVRAERSDVATEAGIYMAIRGFNVLLCVYDGAVHS